MCSEWISVGSPPCPQEGPSARPISPGTCLSASSAGSSPRPPPTSAVAEVLRWQCPSRRGRRRRRSGRRRRNRCRRRRRRRQRQSHQVLQPGRMPRSRPLAPLGPLEVKWKKLLDVQHTVFHKDVDMNTLRTEQALNLSSVQMRSRHYRQW